MDASLGSRIKFYRELRGLSQEGLANRCDVSTTAVSHWETSK